MANIASQEKRILRAERERFENRRYTSAIKTYFRRLEAAVDEGDDDTANAEHRQLTALIDKAVKRGALHRNTGARKKSRAARLRAGSGEAAAPAAKATPAKAAKASSAKSGGAKASGKAKAAPKADKAAPKANKADKADKADAADTADTAE
jgi:small subunit ribosomal protein S20